MKKNNYGKSHYLFIKQKSEWLLIKLQSNKSNVLNFNIKLFIAVIGNMVEGQNDHFKLIAFSTHKYLEKLAYISELSHFVSRIYGLEKYIFKFLMFFKLWMSFLLFVFETCSLYSWQYSYKKCRKVFVCSSFQSKDTSLSIWYIG